MKVKIKKEFYGAEDGINTKLYKDNEVIEVNSEFAELITNKGYAEKYKEKETKVDKPEETKEKTTKKKK